MLIFLPATGLIRLRPGSGIAADGVTTPEGGCPVVSGRRQ
jgi:hypothetical protein